MTGEMFIQLSILTGALPNRWSSLSDGRSGSVIRGPQRTSKTRESFSRRADFFMESDEWLLSRFRLPRHLLMELCNALEPQLRRETRRSNAIPVPVQVCSTFGFLATWSFQREIRSGISQPSISRTMPAVLAAIMSLS